LQSLRDILRNLGLDAWIKYHMLMQRAEAKYHRKLGHLYRRAIRSLAEMLRELGVSEVYMGYPMYISQDRGNGYNADIWWFRRIAR